VLSLSEKNLCPKKIRTRGAPRFIARAPFDARRNFVVSRPAPARPSRPMSLVQFLLTGSDSLPARIIRKHAHRQAGWQVRTLSHTGGK
jgi:hypothetical protein